MASGVTCSAASVRSPSFSRSSSSTTTSMRPARISARAPGTSINGLSKVRAELGILALLFYFLLSQVVDAKPITGGGGKLRDAETPPERRRFQVTWQVQE